MGLLDEGTSLQEASDHTARKTASTAISRHAVTLILLEPYSHLTQMNLGFVQMLRFPCSIALPTRLMQLPVGAQVPDIHALLRTSA